MPICVRDNSTTIWCPRKHTTASSKPSLSLKKGELSFHIQTLLNLSHTGRAEPRRLSKHSHRTRSRFININFLIFRESFQEAGGGGRSFNPLVTTVCVGTA